MKNETNFIYGPTCEFSSVLAYGEKPPQVGHECRALHLDLVPGMAYSVESHTPARTVLAIHRLLIIANHCQKFYAIFSL